MGQKTDATDSFNQTLADGADEVALANRVYVHKSSISNRNMMEDMSLNATPRETIVCSTSRHSLPNQAQTSTWQPPNDYPNRLKKVQLRRLPRLSTD